MTRPVFLPKFPGAPGTARQSLVLIAMTLAALAGMASIDYAREQIIDDGWRFQVDPKSLGISQG